VDLSPEAHNLIDRLLCIDLTQRLGTKDGAAEVKRHPFFDGINWDTLPSEEPSFVPTLDKMEDTSYFDQRGANTKMLPDILGDADEDPSVNSSAVISPTETILSGSFVTPTVTIDSSNPDIRTDTPATPNVDVTLPAETAPDFGAFVYKNLDLLERANHDVVEKLRIKSREGSICSLSSPADVSSSKRTSLLRPRSMSTMSPIDTAAPVSPKSRSASFRSIHSPLSSSFNLTSSFNSRSRVDTDASQNVAISSRRGSLPSALRLSDIPVRNDSLQEPTSPSSDIYDDSLPAVSAPMSPSILENVPSSETYYEALIADDNPVALKILSHILARNFPFRYGFIQLFTVDVRWFGMELKRLEQRWVKSDSTSFSWTSGCR
jgi:serine/threonine-protein kinase RIM15